MFVFFRLAAIGTGCLFLATSSIGAVGSSIADAAMNGDKTLLRTLLQHEADVNTAQADGATAIQWAAYRNDMEMADLLIAAGADVNRPNLDGATPLWLAAENGSAAMIERLLKSGADPNARQPDGATSLMMAARNGNVEAVTVLLAHHADPGLRDSLRGTTALMWAAEQSHPAALKALIEHGAQVNAASNPDTRNSRLNIAPTIQQRIAQDVTSGTRRSGSKANQGEGAAAAADDFAAFYREPAKKDGGGLTPLVFAAREGSLECVQILLASGADVNQTTNYGWTPLLTATQNRHYILAAYLLDHGADPNLANRGGWRPLYLATDNRNIESGDYPVRKPDMDHLAFIKLLIEKGADVNARVCGTESSEKECKGDTTETRTNFTMQWLYEDGATPFLLRAAQSGDVSPVNEAAVGPRRGPENRDSA